MRICQIAIISIVFISVWTQTTDLTYNYQKFLQHYPRSYVGQEKLDHERIFNDTYRQIQRRKAAGEKIDVNNFTDWNQTQLNAYFNYHPENYAQFASTASALRSDFLFASPSSFDWKSLNRVTPVKNQGSCGSCWAFSSTAQYESALAIKLNGTFYDLAEQYGVQCQKLSSGGCNGGYPTAANKLYNQTGIPLQSAFPYKATSSYYGSTICNAANKIKLVANVTKIYHLSSVTVQQLEDIIYNYGPTGIGVYASDLGFRSVNSAGAITCNPVSSINHAILLYGYNSTHWFIKNSWGLGWGNQGYAYISKSGDCGITKWIDVMEVVFNYVPPPPPPTPTNITIIINMTDSYGDGWEGNIFSLRQNGVNVAQFGQAFTSGYSYNTTVVINSKADTQIALTTLGNSTQQIGFVVKFTNGTIIFTRTPGTTFPNLFIFYNLCPGGGCPIPTPITLSINMTDSYGDGWESTILGFKQNNVVVAQFGNGFTTGKVFGPVNVTIPGYINTDIVVYQKGNYTREVGFVVKAPNGTIIHNRTSGTSFNETIIFKTFCPLGICATIPTITYYISLTSSCSGWGKNVLGIRQGGIILANLSLSNGTSSSNPIPVIVQQLSLVEVIVVEYGEKTWQVGFNIRTEIGSSIVQRLPGNAYSADAVLFSYTPGVTNDGIVHIVENAVEQETKYEEEEISVISEKQKMLLILTVVFSITTGIFGVGFIVLLVKKIKNQKGKMEGENIKSEIQSANTINKQVK